MKIPRPASQSVHNLPLTERRLGYGLFRQYRDQIQEQIVYARFNEISGGACIFCKDRTTV